MRRMFYWLMLSCLSWLSGCTSNPSTGREQLLLVSPQETQQMGQQAAPELIKQYGGEVRSPQLRAYVTQVGMRLAKDVEPEYKNVKWQFTTLESDQVNAFSLPGGHVFICLGLLDKLHDEAQVAAVLGHEMGHVTARHVDERISQSTLIEQGGKIASSVVGSGSNSTASQLIPLVVGLGGQGYLLKFSRNQESEADLQGLKYMTRAGYDPKGMAEVMEVLAAASNGSRQWEILATHPDPQHRLEAVQKKISGEYRNTQNNPRYQLYPDRFEQQAAPYLGTSPDKELPRRAPKR